MYLQYMNLLAIHGFAYNTLSFHVIHNYSYMSPSRLDVKHCWRNFMSEIEEIFFACDNYNNNIP